MDEEKILRAVRFVNESKVIGRGSHYAGRVLEYSLKAAPYIAVVWGTLDLYRGIGGDDMGSQGKLLEGLTLFSASAAFSLLEARSRRNRQEKAEPESIMMGDIERPLEEPPIEKH